MESDKDTDGPQDQPAERLWWWLAFIPSVAAMGMLGCMLIYQISTGVGVWGNHHPTMWGWDITSGSDINELTNLNGTLYFEAEGN